MGIKMTVLKEYGVLEVQYSPDPVTGVNLAVQRKQVAEALSRSKIHKVLIDAAALARFPSPFTVLEHNKVVVMDQTLQQAKYAVVCASLGENERCLELTGVNRGIDMRCFLTREEALSWLAE